jgi:hypothetical protein
MLQVIVCFLSMLGVAFPVFLCWRVAAVDLKIIQGIGLLNFIELHKYSNIEVKWGIFLAVEVQCVSLQARTYMLAKCNMCSRILRSVSATNTHIRDAKMC